MRGATVSSPVPVLNDKGMQISASLFGGVLLTCTFALGGCYEPRECGEGTVERDGQCVEAETDAGSSSSGSSASSPSGTAMVDQTYQGCPAGSDVQCTAPEVCFEVVSTCGGECMEDIDCPGPANGNAVQRCERLEFDPNEEGQGCVLFCGGGLECPAGLTCQNVNLAPSFEQNRLDICVAQ